MLGAWRFLGRSWSDPCCARSASRALRLASSTSLHDLAELRLSVEPLLVMSQVCQSARKIERVAVIMVGILQYRSVRRFSRSSDGTP